MSFSHNTLQAERQIMLEFEDKTKQSNKHSVKLSKLLLDTGSNLNLISASHWLTTKTILHTTNPPLKFQGAFEVMSSNVYSNKHVTVDIIFKTKTKKNVVLRKIKFHVVDRLSSTPILGMFSLKHNNIVIGSITGQIQGNSIVQFIDARNEDIHNKTPDKHELKLITSKKCEFTNKKYHIYHIRDMSSKNGALFMQSRTNPKYFDKYDIHNNNCITDEPINHRRFFIQHDHYTHVNFEKCHKIKTRNSKPVLQISEKKEKLISGIQVGQNIPEEYKFRLQQLLRKFGNAVSEDEYDIGRTDKIQCRVNLTSKYPQPCRVFNLPQATIQIVHDEIQKLKRAKIIEEDPSITVVTSYFLPIPKPKLNPDDVQEFRIVSDLKSANNIIESENIEIPRIERQLLQAANHKFISTIDIRKSFWSIPLVEDQQMYFTIQDPLTYQLYKYVCLPMGSRNGSHVMQRAANGLLLKGVNPKNWSSYIDDFIIYHQTLEEHLETLGIILANFEKSGFKLNLKKCLFIRNEVSAFGYSVGEHGVRNDPKRIAAFKKLQFPETKKQLHSNLGLFNYYRKLCPGFSSLAGPLYDALKDDGQKTLAKTDELENAWRCLLNELIKGVTLTRPNYNKRFYLFCDASGQGIGGTLKQKSDDGVLDRIIGIYSYKLKKNELHWENAHKELYGVYRCLCHFEYYLTARRFSIITDNKVVFLCLKSKRNQIGFSTVMSPSYRFIMYIRGFEFDIHHSQGDSPQFILTDLLSRVHMSPMDKILEMGKSTKQALLFVKDIVSGKLEPLQSESAILAKPEKINTIQFIATLPRLDIWKIIKMGQVESLRIKDLRRQILDDHNKNFKIDDFSNAGQTIKNVVMTNKNQIVVPPHMISEVLRNIHKHGESELTLLMKFNDLELSMERKHYNINNFIKSCFKCNEVSPHGKTKVKDMTVQDLSDTNQMVAVDVMKFGTIPIIVYVDEFSLFIRARIMKNEEALETREQLTEIMLESGIPSLIRTDNGPNFTSKAIKELFETFNVVHTTSIVRSSRGNSRAEYSINMIGRELKTLQPDPSGSDLRGAIAIALWTINNQKRRNLKYTPFEIHTGKAINTIQMPEFTNDQKQSLSKIMKKRYDKMEESRKYMETMKRSILNERQNLVQKALMKNKKPKFQKGDIVKLVNPRKPGQLKRLWTNWTTENYRILQVLSYCNSALVQRITNTSILRPRRLRCHFRQMKKIQRRSIDDSDDYEEYRTEEDEHIEEEPKNDTKTNDWTMSNGNNKLCKPDAQDEKREMFSMRLRTKPRINYKY